MSDIKISIEATQSPEVDEEITIIRVDGVIDTMTASELEKVTNSLLEQKRYRIIVDLGGVDYISSAGWGIFISNIREIRLNNGDIKLARMIPNVYEIFELLEFDSILKAFDNIGKAKSDFTGNSSTLEVHSGIEETKKVPVTENIAGTTSKSETTKIPAISMGEIVSSGKTKTDREEGSTSPKSDETVKQKTDYIHKSITSKDKNLKNAIMEMVGKDPFLSVREIRKAIAREFPGTGIIKTWWVLKKLGLGSKKKRFYFARTRRFSK